MMITDDFPSQLAIFIISRPQTLFIQILLYQLHIPKLTEKFQLNV